LANWSPKHAKYEKSGKRLHESFPPVKILTMMRQSHRGQCLKIEAQSLLISFAKLRGGYEKKEMVVRLATWALVILD
jgi:hypothetical protein